tara:strand:- start:527 stop:1165 length:639 start_codon:yes stop_codon:yes gene_type:complete
MHEIQQTSVSVNLGPHELGRLKKEWWVFLVLGVLLAVGGIASITYPFFTTLSVMIFLGMTLIVSGALMIVSAFWTGRWSGFLLQVLAGLFYFVAGFIIADRPIASAAAFTLMIAGFLVVTGVFRIMFALTERFAQWGWVLGSGVISLLMGMIVIKSFRSLETMGPEGILWIIGLIIGIELLACGVTFIMLSFRVKGLPIEQGHAVPPQQWSS